MVCQLPRSLGALIRSLAMLMLAAWVAGCAGSGNNSGQSQSSGTRSPAEYSDKLRKEDLVDIKFSNNPTPPQDVAERIKEDGTINLPLIGSIQAEGKTAGQLQKEIQEKYVPQYFRRLTVTLRTENRVFYVDGEVVRPDRYAYAGEITLLQAIASAGGFTDFASRRRVELVRSTGERLIIDGAKAKDDLKLDVPILPGDRINVPRRSLFGN
ncbi:MAG: polysaccharide biosynthesis/export family protein [Verrucomicrobiales bacterium]|nr:polysaccharide biosynthesis/export family protein [Verrucomicrobiales bacterium]